MSQTRLTARFAARTGCYTAQPVKKPTTGRFDGSAVVLYRKAQCDMDLDTDVKGHNSAKTVRRAGC